MSTISPQRVTTTSSAAGPKWTAHDVLGGGTDARGVRRLLTVDVPDRVIEALEQVLPEDCGPLQCMVTRSKLKPGRKLTVSADVSGASPGVRAVSATWLRESSKAPSRARFLDPVAEPLVRAPFISLRVPTDLTGMAVLVSPLDPDFPQLVDLHDRAYLSRALGTHGLASARDGITVTTLRYRPGQRHVLRIDRREAPSTLYAKCYRDTTGVHARRESERIGLALRAWGGPADVARAVGYVPADQLVLWRGSEGVPLSRLVIGSPELAALAGETLRVIHDSVTMQGESGRSNPGAQVAATARSCEHLTMLAPETAQVLQGLLAVASAELSRIPHEAGHRLHGDYKCDNILVEDQRLRLIDFDRVSVGDPALDLGKMTADLRWWALRAGSDAEPAVMAFLDGYGPCPQDRLRRALHYDVIFQLRAAGRRVALHEPDWDRWVDAVVSCARRTAEDAR